MIPRKIRMDVVDFILGAAKSSHPKEFAGLLRKKNEIIEEVLILPGTSTSDSSALLKLHMLPIDPSVCGSVHSHSSPDFTPSREDLQFFGKFGIVHIIVAFPYDMRSWAAYNHHGEKVKLEVIP